MKVTILILFILCAIFTLIQILPAYGEEQGASQMEDAKKELTVQVVNYPEILVFSKRMIITDFAKGIAKLMNSSWAELNQKGGKPSGPPILLYYWEGIDFTKPMKEVDTEVAWPVSDKSIANSTLPAITAAMVKYVGPYEEFNKVYDTIFAWIAQNGYKTGYPTREIYLNDPQNTKPEDLITEVVIPILKK
ncbi:MAG: GyrI-like domain-containing protein [Candidatus Atribacteria bacterium]|nr:GyrI-like domain-containing protein [Candidatus Atribacteria bacterium]